MAWEDLALGSVFTGSEPGLCVHPLLTEPLWGKPSSSSVSDPAALIAVLIRTEAALRKLATATEKGTEDVDVLGEKVAILRGELGGVYAKLEAPDPGLADYLMRTKLTKLFPRTLAASRDDAAMSQLTKRIPMDAYFAHLSVLNQLVTVANQILHDLESLSNHKYIAHQVALLYQCLSLARSPVESFRAELESNFSSIKRASKGLEHKAGRLPIETAAWLQSLLKQIIEAVHAMPDIYRGPLRPVIRYMKSTETGSF